MKNEAKKVLPNSRGDAEQSHDKEVIKDQGGITELVFILDRSGSMAGLEGDTVGGFNSMLEKQRRAAGECYVTTVLFDGESELLHDRLSLDEVPPMTEEDYQVGGCTALLDALGDAIQSIERIHKYARKEDVPERTLFVITTDGQENASRRHTADRIRRMIERKKKSGWEFLFIGANIDAVSTAARYGIAKSRAVNYNADSCGTRVLYESVSDAILSVRSRSGIDKSWGERIAADHRRRKAGGR